MPKPCPRRARRRAASLTIGSPTTPRPALDQLIKKIEVELDSEKRNDLISKALSIVKEDFVYIPLHQQIVVWASRDNIDLAQLGNNDFQWRYVRMK